MKTFKTFLKEIDIKSKHQPLDDFEIKFESLSQYIDYDMPNLNKKFGIVIISDDAMKTRMNNHWKISQSIGSEGTQDDINEYIKKLKEKFVVSEEQESKLKQIKSGEPFVEFSRTGWDKDKSSGVYWIVHELGHDVQYSNNMKSDYLPKEWTDFFDKNKTALPWYPNADNEKVSWFSQFYFYKKQGYKKQHVIDLLKNSYTNVLYGFKGGTGFDSDKESFFRGLWNVMEKLK